MEMNSELVQKIVNAPESLRRSVEDVLSGRMEIPKVMDVDLRTITFSEASRQSGLSRPTLYRNANIGCIPTVKLVGGSRRILRKGFVEFLYANYNKIKGKKGLAVPLV